MLTDNLPESNMQQWIFTISINSARYGTDLVPTQTFTVEVIVSCIVTEVRYVSGDINDFSLEVDPNSLEPTVINLPAYTNIPCGISVPMQRELKVDSDTPQSLPSFITFSDEDGTITIDLTDPKVTGVYKLIVIATEPISGNFNDEVKFYLEMTCTTTLFYNFTKGVKNIYYEIPADLTSPLVKLPLPVYKTTPEWCLLIPYSLALSKKDQEVSILPTFIKISKNLTTGAYVDVQILNKDPSVTGIYDF
jgi:hypothetical protein